MGGEGVGGEGAVAVFGPFEQNPFEGVVRARRRPGFIVEPQAIAWNAVAFNVRGHRNAVACVPRNALSSFLEDLDDGRLDQVICEFLASPPSGRVLRAVEQTDTPGLFDELSSPAAIVPAERRPGRPGLLGRGGGTPTGPRRNKRSRRPRPRRLLVAGAVVAAVVTVAAVAVALQNNDKSTPAVAAGDRAQSAPPTSSIETTTLAPGTGGACMARPANLTAWWSGDGNATDLVGGRNGTMQAGAGFASTGEVGPAFDFTRGGSFTVPNDPLWSLPGDFTIDLWVNFAAPASGRLPFIAHDDAAGSQNKWIFWFDDQGDGPEQNNVPALRFHINGSSPSSNPIWTPWKPTVNEWHFVAITRSGSNFALYIDSGVPAQTATDANPIPAASVPLSVGAAEAFPFPGQIDEVQLFSRALGSDEIASIFNAGAAGTCKQ